MDLYSTNNIQSKSESLLKDKWCMVSLFRCCCPRLSWKTKSNETKTKSYVYLKKNHFMKWKIESIYQCTHTHRHNTTTHTHPHTQPHTHTHTHKHTHTHTHTTTHTHTHTHTHNHTHTTTHTVADSLMIYLLIFPLLMDAGSGVQGGVRGRERGGQVSCFWTGCRWSQGPRIQR